jgi:hypothetical protein
MNRANIESLDSPFSPFGTMSVKAKTKVLKQKLCGGISLETPTYFHLKHITVLDPKSRTEELLKGYKPAAATDYKLIYHPELVSQDKKYFAYEDFLSNGGKKIFDYSTLKPSNLIDLLADKRPEFKMSSNFYKRYNDKLSKDGFGLTRGIFTVESNQRFKFGMTASKFAIQEPLKTYNGNFKSYSSRDLNLEKEIISEQAKTLIPAHLRIGRKSMERFLNTKEKNPIQIRKHGSFSKISKNKKVF